ncbi:mechanosensitive ion channel domain-containing protein [Notoacmeibacter ruber]|uniref:Mechanosensitive ion channel protein n=1 Tax=Notoacmeibacter ruber TaxID=2670375 RepID=A0A3L7JCN8_9HYPH|nr:mechanosensitive ion channel domain-containing protein [Notoacmeibacter ruber]RLQ87341.1 mechanosensitive ion channel protein [Notoacmeibacter ruber]
MQRFPAASPRRIAVLFANALFVLFLAVAGAAAQSTSSGGGDGGSSGPPSRWFEVDQLNEGLGEPGANLSRETPQSAMETFIGLVRDKRYEDAAHLLDLSHIDVADQKRLGIERAAQLEAVLERKIWLDWDSLSDRPDGMDPRGSSRDATAGQPRRDISLGQLSLDYRPVSIRLRRLKEGDSDPVWVFSRQTVDNIEGLYESYGPSRFEKWLPASLTKNTPLGIAGWELIALPIAIAVLVAAFLLTYRSLRSLKSNVGDGVLWEVLDAIALPAGSMVTGIIGWLLTRYLFVFSAPVDVFMSPLWTAFLVLALIFLIVRVFDTILERVFARNIDDISKPENEGDRELQTNLSAARRIALIVVAVAGFGLVLLQTTIFDGMAVALLGSAGLLTLVIGFAARSALSSIMSSLQIALSKSAKIGDDVLFEGYWCTVERINFTFIQLRSWDRRRIIVPVDYFVSHPFENWTKKDATITKYVELRLNHLADLEPMREAFQKFVEDDEDIITKNESKVQVVGHEASGMLVRFYADARDPTSGWNMQCRLREAMIVAAARLEPKRGDQAIFLPAEREAKIVDLTTDNSSDSTDKQN